ncbi:phage holin [Staphylococcus saprophyticus]|uniref:phage holin n=1 Tax=Staphylococcus saprophyticus TaxID=29385 RepID=UPI001A903A67|nr:phage holin [Staphylococcus saprophyticus]MBO0382602.1 phage holin [Staphylococcus saprophyticus]
MNFILRLKNKATLTALVGAILLFIKQITEAFGVDLSAQIEQVSGLIGAIITFLVGIGVVTDPTTKGVKDSGITKTYTKPRDENENPVEYQSEGNTFMPKEYDTREDFSDDSDEVEFYSTLADGGQHPDEAKYLEDEEQPEDDTDEGLGQRGVDNGKN